MAKRFTLCLMTGLMSIFTIIMLFVFSVRFENEVAFAEEEILNFTSESASSFSGSGTDENPYIISSEAQLSELADLVNGYKTRSDGKLYSTLSYKLTNDLDMSGIEFTPIGNSELFTNYLAIPSETLASISSDLANPDFWASFKTIAYEHIGNEYVLTQDAQFDENSEYFFKFDLKNSFYGKFDGNGHTIFDLSIEGNTESGLFGRIQNAHISDLIIDCATIETELCGGGIAGVSVFSEISRCYVINSFIFSYVPDSICGGIIGYSPFEYDYEMTYFESDGEIMPDSTIFDLPIYPIPKTPESRIDLCLNNGTTVFSFSYAGGICGKSDSKIVGAEVDEFLGLRINNCFNCAEIGSYGIGGGIIGFTSGPLKNCFSITGGKGDYYALIGAYKEELKYPVILVRSFYPNDIINDDYYELHISQSTEEILDSNFLSQNNLDDYWIQKANVGSTYYYPCFDEDYVVPFTAYVVNIGDKETHIVNSGYGKLDLPSAINVPVWASFDKFAIGDELYDLGETVDINCDTYININLSIRPLYATISQVNFSKTYDTEYSDIATISFDNIFSETTATYEWYYSKDKENYEKLTGFTENTIRLKNVCESGYYSCLVSVFDENDVFITSEMTLECNVTIAPASASVITKLSYYSETYSGNSIELSPTVEYTGIYESDIQSIEARFEFSDEVKNAGTYDITAVVENTNYTFDISSCQFTVIPAEISCVSTDLTVIYDGYAHYPLLAVTTVDDCVYTIEYSLDDIHYKENLSGIQNIGTYDIYYKVLADNHNESGGLGQVTIVKNTITFVKKENAPILEKTYDSTISCSAEKITTDYYSVNYASSFDGVQPFSILSSSYSVSSASNEVIDVIVRFKLDNTNFDLENTSITLEGKINPAEISITKVSDHLFEKTYDGTNVLTLSNGFSDIRSYLNIIADYYTFNINIVTGTLNSAHVDDADSVTFELAVSGNNYILDESSSSFTFSAKVLPRMIQIVPDSVIVPNKKYDGTDIVEVYGGELSPLPADSNIITLPQDIALVFGKATVNDISVSDESKPIYFESIGVSDSDYYVLDTLSGELTVIIERSIPTVNPKTTTEYYANFGLIDEIGLSEGDTDGTIEWCFEYEIGDVVGVQTFYWTFTPTDTESYESITESIEINVIPITPTGLRAEFDGRNIYDAFEEFDTKNLQVYVIYNNERESLLNQKTSYNNGYYVYYGENRKVFYASDKSITIRYTFEGHDFETLIPVTVNKISIRTPSVLGQQVFNGNELVLSLDSAFSLDIMTIEGNVGTHAGNYTATITLKDFVNYNWVNSETDSISVDWVISPLSIRKPKLQNDEYIYSGENIIPTILHNDKYTQNGKHTDIYSISGSTEGMNCDSYEIEIAFISTDYIWYEDGKTDVVRLRWQIIPAVVAAPALDKTVYETSFTVNDGVLSINSYEIEILKSEYYEISGDTVYDIAKNYSVIVTLKDSDNYIWDNGRKAPIMLTYTVNKLKLDKPTYGNTNNYIYNGKTFAIPVFTTDYYTVDGQVSSQEVGNFTITITINDEENIAWSDGTSDPIVIKWSVDRAEILDPTLNGNTTYNGEEQTAFIVYDSVFCEISGNKGRETGKYTAKVKLKDKKNCAWSNGTTNDIDIIWYINPNIVDIPKVPSSNLIYNGLDQTIPIALGSTYTVTGNTGTEIGTYTAIVSLKDKVNYKWRNGSSDDLKLEWKICGVKFFSAGQEIDLSYNNGGALQVPYRKGYKFLGWYLTEDFSGESVTQISKITDDIVLYAKWEEDKAEIVKDNKKSDGLSSKAIVGISLLGGAALIAVLIIILGVVLKKKHPGGPSTF